LSQSIKADVVYNYTGDSFTSYSGTYNSATETNITATLTLSSALGADFNGTVAPASVVSFEISDGSLMLTNTSLDITPSFDFVTNGSGQITGWGVSVIQNISPPAWTRLLTESGADESVACGGGPVGEDCIPFVGNAEVDYSGNQPGWTESAVPEPRFTVILGALLAALAVTIRRKATSPVK